MTCGFRNNLLFFHCQRHNFCCWSEKKSIIIPLILSCSVQNILNHFHFSFIFCPAQQIQEAITSTSDLFDMKNCQFSNAVGVDGADRRFRCCGRRSRCGIFCAAATTITILSVLNFALVATAFSVEQRQNAHGIHRIVFGTAALSKAEDPLSLLDAAFEKGFRRFDLAHTYGAGASERIFGQWLSSRSEDGSVDRSNLDIITKGGIGDDAFGDPNRPLLTRQALHDEIEESLSALHTDFVDLYMFHRDDRRLSVDQFVDWINEAVTAGKIKRWGVSNWNFDRFQAAHEYAKSKGLVPPSANSPQYSLAVPDGEVWPSTYSISSPDNSHEIDWYNDRGVELVCWEGEALHLCFIDYY